MKKVVLIVDDSKLARMTLRAIIADDFPDWYISEASNGADALSFLDDVQTDFIFLDYNMPGANGLEVAADIRKKLPKAAIALITANIQDAIAERARALDVEFFTKPINVEALVTYLRAGDQRC